MKKIPIFKKIPPHIIREVAMNNEKIPTLYSHKNFFLRESFWLRLRFIHRLMLKNYINEKNCFDFGGGGGVFLPTLSYIFEHVACGDKFCNEAESIVKIYGLKNVDFFECDLLNFKSSGKTYDVVIAADVLEHFPSLLAPVTKIKELLKAEGVLFTSLPSENSFYLFLRKIFGIQKPSDHYHTATQVESFLEAQGFLRIQTLYVPLYVPLFKLFHVSAWKRND